MTFVWHVFKMQNILLFSLKRNLIFFLFFLANYYAPEPFLCAPAHTAHTRMYVCLKAQINELNDEVHFRFEYVFVSSEKNSKFKRNFLRMLYAFYVIILWPRPQPQNATPTPPPSIHHHQPATIIAYICCWLSCAAQLEFKISLNRWMVGWMVGLVDCLFGWSMMEWNFLMLIC